MPGLGTGNGDSRRRCVSSAWCFFFFFLFSCFFLLLLLIIDLTSSPLVPGTTPLARKCDVGWMLDYLSNHNSNFVNGHNLHNNGKFPGSVFFFFYFFKSFTYFLLLATTYLPQRQQQWPRWRARRPPIINTNAYRNSMDILQVCYSNLCDLQTYSFLWISWKSP